MPAWSVSGLRTRYVPRNRLGQGLVGAAPWINLLLLVALFALVDRRLVLQPGVMVDLPRASFRDGARSELVAVVVSVRGAAPGEREDVVFFDDVRYRVGSPDQRAKLKRSLAGRVRVERDATLIIQADRAVRHGTVTDLMDMAIATGVRRVDLAARPF